MKKRWFVNATNVYDAHGSIDYNEGFINFYGTYQEALELALRQNAATLEHAQQGKIRLMEKLEEEKSGRK